MRQIARAVIGGGALAVGLGVWSVLVLLDSLAILDRRGGP